jgi:hypothetical protein
METVDAVPKEDLNYASGRDRDLTEYPLSGKEYSGDKGESKVDHDEVIQAILVFHYSMNNLFE